MSLRDPERHRALGAPWPLRAALTIGVVGGPQLAIQLLAPETRHLPGVFAAASLALMPVCLMAAFLLYLHWRLVGSSCSGIATTCLALFGAHGFTMGCLWITRDEQVGVSVGGVMLNVATLAALVTVGLRGERLLAYVDPLAAGVALGLTVSVADVVVLRVLPAVASSDGFWALSHAVVLAVGVAVAALIVVRDADERWATLRLSLALGLLTLPLLTLSVTDDTAVLAALLTAGVIGAVLLCDTAISMLGHALHEKVRAVVGLQERLDRLDAERRDEEERLHEIRGTIAGIASASHLIRAGLDLEPARRARLEEMLELESGRLARLVHDVPIEATPRRVDLDTMIRPLVTAQQALGRSITWRPTGDLVNGDPDRLSEALNILLDNAAKHASGADAEIHVHRDSGTVRIEVKDNGPGVARHLRDHVFSRGVKGSASQGRGLGLHLAHRLLSESGSTLTLAESEHGARFLIDLQPARAARTGAEG